MICSEVRHTNDIASISQDVHVLFAPGSSSAAGTGDRPGDLKPRLALSCLSCDCHPVQPTSVGHLPSRGISSRHCEAWRQPRRHHNRVRNPAPRDSVECLHLFTSALRNSVTTKCQVRASVVEKGTTSRYWQQYSHHKSVRTNTRNRHITSERASGGSASVVYTRPSTHPTLSTAQTSFCGP